jgi:WD40 repeat protein
VAAGKPVGKLGGITGGGVAFAFNFTGSMLASRGWSGIVRLWDTRNNRQIFSVQAHADDFRFSPDGRFLAATEHRNRLGICEIAAGREYCTLTGNPMSGDRPYSALALTGDGRWLAAGGAAGSVFIWDLNTGRELPFLGESQGNYFADCLGSARQSHLGSF